MLRLAYDNNLQRADLVKKGGHFDTTLDLETVVTISLFTERREPSEIDPGELYRGGWPGDSFDEDGDLIGSRLWRLRRKTATEANLATAKAFIEEALAWMLRLKVARSIVVTTAKGETLDMLRFTTAIHQPGDKSPWSKTWEKHFNEL